MLYLKNIILILFGIFIFIAQTREFGDDASIAFTVECIIGACMNDLVVEDMAYGNPLQIEGQIVQNRIIRRDVSKPGNWYDYRLREINDNGVIVMERRFMGRVETGKDSITDPAMAIPRVDEDIDNHPDVTWHFEAFIENERLARLKKKTEFECQNEGYIEKHGFVKDVCWGNMK